MDNLYRSITSQQRNLAIDKYPQLDGMIDSGVLNYSKNALSSDFKNFRFNSWVFAHKWLCIVILAVLTPLTWGFGLLGFIVLLVLIRISARGFLNYYELVEEYFPNTVSINEGLKNISATHNKISDFSGEASLTNDAYKIYLSKKFKIQKNDLFNKFEVNGQLFETLDDALLCAHDMQSNIYKKTSEEYSAIGLKKNDTQEESKSLEEDSAKGYNITFDGEKYIYKSYRYENLADAINFAKLDESRNKS